MSSVNGDLLPEGWKRLRVGDSLKLLNGRAFKTSEWTTSGRPIIRIQNLKSGEAPFNYFEGELPERFAAATGDLLFAWSGTPGTSFGAHIWEGPDAWINQHIFRVDFSEEEFHRDFLKLALDFNLHAYISQAQGGVGLAHITKSKLEDSFVLAPPLDEQRRIARAVGEAGAKRQSSLAHLRTARRTIARFRQGVLAAACAGRLTADWREQTDAPAWTTERAEDVCSKVQSGTTPKIWSSESAGVPFLKVYNIVDQTLDFDHRRQFISLELHAGPMRRATALPGDVLMNIVGPPLGKVAIVSDQYPEWSINQALTLFRPSQWVTTDWLYIFLCSGLSVDEVLSQTRGTVGQVNISLTQCRDFIVPVPSVAEQKEIARRAYRLLDAAHEITSRVEAARRSVERSSQALLTKAFRGDLIANGGAD